jgi:hypothetical protein
MYVTSRPVDAPTVSDEQDVEQPAEQPVQESVLGCTLEQAIVTDSIAYTDNGVVPSCARIASGVEMTWVNESSTRVQVSSDPHPVHTDNPEISDGEFVINLGPGERASVTLVTAGEFGHHDHLSAFTGGTIFVE